MLIYNPQNHLKKEGNYVKAMAPVSSCSVSVNMSFLDMLLLNAAFLVAVTDFVECRSDSMEDNVGVSY